MCGGKCNFNSKISMLDSSEKEELELLRNKIKVYESLCLAEKFTEVWNYGWDSAKFSGADNSIQTKNELWRQDKENIILDELQILMGESILEDERQNY